MATVLDEMLDSIAHSYVARGEGTGGVSKVLSFVTMLVSTVFLVQLLKDAQYTALAILAVLVAVLVPLGKMMQVGSIVTIALLIYFAFQRYWTGVGLVSAFLAANAAAVTVGRRNVKNLLRRGSPMINPFESTPDIGCASIVACLCLAACLVVPASWSYILWSLFGVAVLFLSARVMYRMMPRWRQVHYPLMVRFARAAGEEYARARHVGVEVDQMNVLRQVLSSVYPARGEAEVSLLLDGVRRAAESFSDKEGIRAELLRRKSVTGDADAAMDALASAWTREDRSRILTVLSIAEVVTHVFGEEERSRYLVDWGMGKAR